MLLNDDKVHIVLPIAVIIILWAIGLTLCLLCLFSPSFYYMYIEPIKNPEFHEIYDNVYVEDNLDESYEAKLAKSVEDKLQDLPLYLGDYNIILTNKQLQSSVEYAQGHSIAGITRSKRRTIQIRYEYVDYALIHEIGHAVDATYGFSDTEEFQELYNREDHDTYATCNIKEYFASSYDLFVRGQLIDAELCEYFSQKAYGKSFFVE